MKNRPIFTREQEEWINYCIDAWSLGWKDRPSFSEDNQSMRVHYQAEHLKDILNQKLSNKYMFGIDDVNRWDERKK